MSDTVSDQVNDDPAPPVLRRNVRTANYAPEVMQLIERGILDEELEVCRGWVESGKGSSRRFIQAPTVEEMAIAYRRDTTRRVHTIDLPNETVLDFPKMCALEKVCTKDEFRELSQEWGLMIVSLFRAHFGDR